MTDTAKDWSPGAYDRFRDVRLRPALDLIARLEAPRGPVVDLGCGSGAAGPALRSLAGTARLIGLDSSPAMLSKAAATEAYDLLEEADIARWRPDAAPALIFSNAALHWLGDHATLLPRLAGLLAPGGTLAVQVPHQNNAPSHRIWHSLVEEHFPGRFDPATAPGIERPATYHAMLSPLGQLDLWEVDYYQVLPKAEEGHPVRLFTQSTFARPVLDSLPEDEQAQLIALYDEVIEAAYPRSADGSVLFPFRRLFFTLRPAG
ncbi:methyltransferase domain-containing protein [Pseudooceanicola nanhaiensis]|nr:methyltransferase domain-containing protein [Pseudooceanicola nanhaiensis]